MTDGCPRVLLLLSATASTCFHRTVRFANSWRTFSECYVIVSNWRAAKSMWKTFGSQTKRAFAFTASLISRTGAFSEWKISMLPTIVPASTKRYGRWYNYALFPRKDSQGYCTDSSIVSAQFLSHSILAAQSVGKLCNLFWNSWWLKIYWLPK